MPFVETFFPCFVSSLSLGTNSETGYVTSEKAAPSPVSMVADVFQAVEVERKFANSRPGMKATLKDLLARVTADYNRMVSLRRHRIDTPRKSLLYNMLLGSESFGLSVDVDKIRIPWRFLILLYLGEPMHEVS